MPIFPVLWLVLKQIIKDWKLELILLSALILAVAVVSSISFYTDGVLQRVMLSEWDSFIDEQANQAVLKISNEQWKLFHPLFLKDQNYTADEVEQINQQLENYLQEQIPTRFAAIIENFSKVGRSNISPVKSRDSTTYYLDLRFIDNLGDRVRITSGKWYGHERAMGKDTKQLVKVEAVVSTVVQDKFDLIRGESYLFLLGEQEQELRHLAVEIVGIFEPKADNEQNRGERDDLLWSDSFFISPTVFEEIINQNGLRPYQQDWIWGINLSRTKYSELAGLLNNLKYIKSRTNQITGVAKINEQLLDFFNYQVLQGNLLKRFLLILSLPVIGMLFYYIIIMIKMVLNHRSKQIRMLCNRGAGFIQLLMIYQLEWILLGVFALLLGPLLGLFLAKVMGLSNGFLNFVNRESLPTIGSLNSFYLPLLVIAGFLVMGLCLLVPVVKENISGYHHAKARSKQRNFIQKYYLDLILIIISVFSYRNLQLVRQQPGSAAGLLLDPVLFIVPVLIITTIALISLRIIPLIIKIIDTLTTRMPGIVLSITLKPFHRNFKHYSPLLFFIIITVSLGIYSASIARTIDQNFIDAVMYKNGAELILTEYTGSAQEGEASVNSEYQIPFYLHQEIEGIKDFSRVFRKKATIDPGRSYSGTLMAIDPYDFAQVAWFRHDLAEWHFYEYLNRLLDAEQAALVNRDFFVDNQLKLGDWLTVRFEDAEVNLYIAGVVEYWPTVYPESFPLVVANLDYILNQSLVKPATVWLTLENEASLASIIEQLNERGIWVVDYVDSQREIIIGKREPQRMGFFGMLSIGFIIAVAITVMGYFLYIFLSLKRRITQFGLLRSIGLSITQMIVILSLEQIIIVGSAFLIGTGLGVYSCHYFLPQLEVTQNIGGVVPDFLVAINSTDILQILNIISVALIVVLAGLVYLLSKIKLYQAVKIGEDIR